MSPLEALQALFAQKPYAGFLGFEASAQGGEVLLTLPFKPELVGNPFIEAIHGGVIGAAMEMAAEAQLALAHEADKVRKPINIQIYYLRGATAQPLFAAAKIVRIGRRTAHVQAEAWQDQRDKPVALLHAHYLVEEIAP